MNKTSHPANELSFVRAKLPKGSGVDWWDVTTAGDYVADYKRGQRFGLEFVAYLENHPVDENANLLNWIAHDMGLPRNGLSFGFFGAVGRSVIEAAQVRQDGRTEPSAVSVALAAYNAAEAAWRPFEGADETPDKVALFEEKENADHAVVIAPCRTLEDAQAKARLALSDENFMDSLESCTWGDESCLTQFLRSILGDAG